MEDDNQQLTSRLEGYRPELRSTAERLMKSGLSFVFCVMDATEIAVIGDLKALDGLNVIAHLSGTLIENGFEEQTIHEAVTRGAEAHKIGVEKLSER